MLDEERHGKYRRPIQHAYSLTSLKGYELYIDEVINMLLANIQRHAREGKPVNISSWLYYCELFANPTFK